MTRAPRAGKTRLIGVHRSRLQLAAAAAMSAAARQPELSAGHAVFALIVLGSIYFLYHRRQQRTGAAGGSGRDHHCCRPRRRTPRCSRGCCTTQQVYETSCELSGNRDHVFQLDVPGQSIAGMVLKPWDQRTRIDRRCCSRWCSRTAGEDRRARRSSRSSRRRCRAASGLPVQFVIGTTEPFAAAERRGAEFPAGRASKRHVHLPRQRSEDRRAAVDGRDRPRQGGAARPEDERCRQRAGRRCWAAAMSIISASTAGPTRSFRRCSSASG